MLKALTDAADAIGSMFFTLDRPRQSAAPQAPSPPAEPPVCAQALLDLALVMRDRYWPEGDFARGADHALAFAALARIFPHRVAAIERCPCAVIHGCAPGALECTECTTDADIRRFDDALTRHLAKVARPLVMRTSPRAAGSSSQ